MLEFLWRLRLGWRLYDRKSSSRQPYDARIGFPSIISVTGHRDQEFNPLSFIQWPKGSRMWKEKKRPLERELISSPATLTCFQFLFDVAGECPECYLSNKRHKAANSIINQQVTGYKL